MAGYFFTTKSASSLIPMKDFLCEVFERARWQGMILAERQLMIISGSPSDTAMHPEFISPRLKCRIQSIRGNWPELES